LIDDHGSWFSALSLITSVLILMVLQIACYQINAATSNSNSIAVLHSGNCIGVVCQSLSCITNICRTYSSQTQNSSSSNSCY